MFIDICSFESDLNAPQLEKIYLYLSQLFFSDTGRSIKKVQHLGWTLNALNEVKDYQHQQLLKRNLHQRNI